MNFSQEIFDDLKRNFLANHRKAAYESYRLAGCGDQTKSWLSSCPRLRKVNRESRGVSGWAGIQPAS